MPCAGARENRSRCRLLSLSVSGSESSFITRSAGQSANASQFLVHARRPPRFIYGVVCNSCQQQIRSVPITCEFRPGVAFYLRSTSSALLPRWWGWFLLRWVMGWNCVGKWNSLSRQPLMEEGREIGWNYSERRFVFSAKPAQPGARKDNKINYAFFCLRLARRQTMRAI